MTRAEQETTAPIKRDELLGLLDAMAETEAPPVRASGSWPATRNFSQLAALLPPCAPTRFPRATQPPLVVRAKTPTEQKAARTVAEARARLDTAEETAEERASSRERVSFPVLSAMHDGGEEIAMLPMRLTLTPVPGWHAPPRIEITAVAGDAVFIHSMGRTDHAVPVEVPPSGGFAPIIASFAALLAVGFCAGYFLF